MQKLWLSRSKRSQPLPLEGQEQDASSSLPDTHQETQKAPQTSKNRLQNFQQFFEGKISVTWLILALGLSGVILVAAYGLRYLTAPESTPDSNLTCKSKVGGDWQSPLGKITLQEKGNEQVVGKYEYANFERGKIAGEFTGKLENNVITFDWQETQNKQPKQQGRGVLVLAEGCKEFYGSYGTGDSTNNFGNWQGTRIKK